MEEVIKLGFVLNDRIFKECLHDDYYNKCVILNFTRLNVQ